MCSRLTVVLSLFARQAYDGHMNMVLSEVEEQISILEIDEASNQQKIRVSLVEPLLVWYHR